MTSLTSYEMQTQPRTELSQLVTYIHGGSLKKYSEVKLTNASAVTEKWAEMLEEVEDTMTLSCSSVTEMPAKRQRTENPGLPYTCQVTRSNKTFNAHLLIRF